MKKLYSFGPFMFDSETFRLTKDGAEISLDADCRKLLNYLLEQKVKGKTSNLHSANGLFGWKGRRSSGGFYWHGKAIAEALGQSSNDGPYLQETQFGHEDSFWGPEWTVWNFIADIKITPSEDSLDNSTPKIEMQGKHQERTNWDLFISHASEDKESIARPLANLLRAKGLTVWLDENQLRLGDSLLEKIEEGLSRCHYGLVIISKAFFAKQWPRRELNGLFAREIVGQKIVLPVWHGVDRDTVVKFSPILADRLAVTTDHGIDYVVRSILEAICPTEQTDVKAIISPEIPGKWNSVKVEGLVLGKLAEEEGMNRNTFCETTDSPLEHWVIGEYYLRYHGSESMMVVTASIEEGNDCHPCGPALSLFEFRRTEDGWKLTDSSIAVTKWGQWGNLEPDDVKVFVLGENIYALFLHGGSTGQGYVVSNISIQARVGDRYQEILSLQTTEDDSGSMNPGKEDWSSTIRIQPGTSGFYDLLVTRRGKRMGEKFSQTERFKFDGQKYTSSGLYT